jgi:hypothetical protein
MKKKTYTLTPITLESLTAATKEGHAYILAVLDLLRAKLGDA